MMGLNYVIRDKTGRFMSIQKNKETGKQERVWSLLVDATHWTTKAEAETFAGEYKHDGAEVVHRSEVVK